MISKLYFFCLAALGLPLSAAASFAQESLPLPVRKVELYKNGMGFFEHLGTVKGSQTVEISLPSSQLNDVLKSLTVLDLGHGQISGVNYDSTAPLDRRLSETPINLGFEHGIVDFLNQIRGAGIEVGAPGGVISGKLMGAEVRTRSTGPGASSEAVQVSIYTGGEVRLVELESAGALKITEPALAVDLGRYLDLLDTSHRRDIRRLKIQTSGTGERQLYVSYTSESPIWKTTYRIVLDPKQKALLQGWAIVDNTTPIDWINVSLALVAGAPISFIQNLSQPIYGKRPVIPLPEGVQANPQVYEATMEPQAAPSVGPGSGGGAGSGVGGARREMMKMAAGAPSAPAPLDRLGGLSDAIRQQVTETAQAQAIGEQFEYKLR
jgi:hypothetical protein